MNRPTSRLVPRLLLTPAIATLFLWMIVPLVMTIYFSLIRYNLMQPDVTGFAGLENFEYFVTDPSFWPAVLNTCLLLGSVIVITVLLGIGLFFMIGLKFYPILQLGNAFLINQQLTAFTGDIAVALAQISVVAHIGTGADAGQTTFRLRHAYGEWGPLLAGQTNTLFMDGDVFPNTIDYWGPAGMVFYRNVQIRWTPYKTDNSHFAIAIERPSNDIDAGSIRTIEGLEDVDVRNDEELPDLTAQFRYGGDWGHVRRRRRSRPVAGHAGPASGPPSASSPPVRACPGRDDPSARNHAGRPCRRRAAPSTAWPCRPCPRPAHRPTTHTGPHEGPVAGRAGELGDPSSDR